MNDGRIFLVADLHTPHFIKKVLNSNFVKKYNINSKDYIIILGDTGLLSSNKITSEEKYIHRYLDDKPFTTLFIDGNHDNINIINNLDQIKLFDSIVGKLSDKIFHLHRGCIYNILNKNILTIGGAFSIDYIHRRQDLNWWKDEILSPTDRSLILCNTKYKYDYILSHDCPLHVIKLMHKRGYEICNIYGHHTNKFLDDIYSISKNKDNFKHWYFGHYHYDIDRLSVHFSSIFREIKIL